MLEEPLFLKPVFQEKIWGGSKLSEVFGYTLPSEKIGECWAISAHPHGVSIVENGLYKGEGLDGLWDSHRELFGDSTEKTFPLLTKILDAEEELSVQVHPNDEYALKHEGELGKTECWYILDAVPGAEIVYGHYAQTKEELEALIREENWDRLLRKIPVKKGDFYYVPSGTIHAIGKGIIVLETQQNSDTTYRVYDYDRLDDNGNKRELHIEDSVAVTTVPHHDPILSIQQVNHGDSSITTFIKSDYFYVYEWNISGVLNFSKQAPYTLVSVVEGIGKLIVEDPKTNDRKSYKIEMGDHFILTSGIEKWRIEGSLQIIASEPGTKNR